MIITLTCKYCKKEFRAQRSFRRTYCSRLCFEKAMKVLNRFNRAQEKKGIKNYKYRLYYNYNEEDKVSFGNPFSEDYVGKPFEKIKPEDI